MSYQVELYGGQYEIRDDMLISLEYYVKEGQPTGDFLNAVLTNNLVDALAYADEEDFANIQAFASYLYKKVPAKCWRTQEKVNAWIKKGGQEGLKEKSA